MGVPYVGLSRIHPSAPVILAICFGVVLFLVFLGVTLLLFTIIRGRDLVFSQNLRGIVIQVLFPFMVLVGKLVGISKRSVQQSFIAVNNQLVLSNSHPEKADKILLLLPHCIQAYIIYATWFLSPCPVPEPWWQVQLTKQAERRAVEPVGIYKIKERRRY